MENGGLPLSTAQRTAAQPPAASADADEVLDQAAKAVTAKRQKDPYLEAIRRVRDCYASLSPKVRKRVHVIVGQLYVDDEDDACPAEVDLSGEADSEPAHN